MLARDRCRVDVGERGGVVETDRADLELALQRGHHPLPQHDVRDGPEQRGEVVHPGGHPQPGEAALPCVHRREPKAVGDAEQVGRPRGAVRLLEGAHHELPRAEGAPGGHPRGKRRHQLVGLLPGPDVEHLVAGGQSLADERRRDPVEPPRVRGQGAEVRPRLQGAQVR